MHHRFCRAEPRAYDTEKFGGGFGIRCSANVNANNGGCDLRGGAKRACWNLFYNARRAIVLYAHGKQVGMALRLPGQGVGKRHADRAVLVADQQIDMGHFVAFARQGFADEHRHLGQPHQL